MSKSKGGPRKDDTPTAVPAQDAVPLRWRVEFPWSPTLDVEAATEADAWVEYKRLCHILDTPHEPRISLLSPADDDDGETG